MKFFCKKYPYGLIYKINFKFLGRTVSEKNGMLTCKISMLFIRTIVQLGIFARYDRIFLKSCATEENEYFFCKKYPYGLIYKINFRFLCRTISEKNAMLIASYHRIFLENCVTEEHEFFFIEYPYGLIYKINFKFLGCTVSEKNVMLTCKIS